MRGRLEEGRVLRVRCIDEGDVSVGVMGRLKVR
jgi:hypothetical protein